MPELSATPTSKAQRDISHEAGGLRAGFTLVEMLVVLVIIGLVMGLVGPRVLNSLTDARAKTAKLQIESLGSSLDLYYLDVGRYPSTSEGLGALVTAPGGLTGWNGPYLKGGAVPNDPWGQAYTYRSPAATAPFEIVSFGSAGREGGGTEIKSQAKR